MNVFVEIKQYIISFDIGKTSSHILTVDIYKDDGEYLDSFAVYASSEDIPEMFLKRLPDLSCHDIKFFTSEVETLVREPNNGTSFLDAMQRYRVSDNRLKELGLKTPDDPGKN